MPVIVTTTGGAKAIRVGMQLKRLGNGELTHRVTRRVRGEAPALIAAVHDSVPAYMPRRGGYAGTLGRALKIRGSDTSGGVKLVAHAFGKAAPRDLRSLQGGVLRHPIWGHRSHWAVTSIRPGFFTEPIERKKDQLVRALSSELHRIAKSIG